jgi:hypothetical protein
MNSRLPQRPKPRNTLQRLIRQIARFIWRIAAGFSRIFRSHSPAGWLMLLLWVVGALWVSHQAFQGLEGNTTFDTAFHTVAHLGDDAGDASVGRWQKKFGISQPTYSRWRQAHNQPLQSVAEMTEAEAKALYRSYWQKAQCSQFQPPLDIACLDSVMSFGVENGKSFLINLPEAPQMAAIEVATRRIDYRQRQFDRINANPLYPDTVTPDRADDPREFAFPGARRTAQERRLVAQGLQRDRSLLAFAESYKPAPPADPISSLTRRIQTQLNPAQAQPLTAAEIYAKAKPFTVEVWITLEDGTVAPATGIIVSADGLVITNAHVVEGNPRPTIRIRDQQDKEQEYTGKVIADDHSVDLALIQLSGVSQLPVAPLAEDTMKIKLGDRVYALGSPVGEHWKLSQDQVIALQSQCGIPNLKCIRMPKGFLHPGNSGGPLLDQTGTVIGINRALQERTGEGVSIPIEVVKQFLRQQGKLPG